MLFEYRKFIKREDLRAEPDTLFVFGDNLMCAGFGGQAAEMRGEPNAVGIPTKHRPDNHEASFLCDEDILNPVFMAHAGAAAIRLTNHIHHGGKVVWPADGIGTGLANLKSNAPAIWNWIEWQREELASQGATVGALKANPQ